MASNVVPASSEQPKKQGNLSLSGLSHQVIKTKICPTHVHDDEKYCDVQSLFIVVENILKRATLLADNVALGTQATVEHLEEKTPNASFIPPLCTLKSISYEMQFKCCTGKETAYETTVQSILKKLSNYSWDAKALLTLTAFALDYGEFWLLVQSLQSSNSDNVLAKSVATLRRVSVPLKDPIKQAIIELNNVIKATLEVIEHIFELEKLLNQIDVEDLGDNMPVYVFWAIVTVVASTTQLCCLTSGDHDKQQELSQFSHKLKEISNELKSRIKICKQKKETAETNYLNLKKLFLTAPKILDVLEGLINSEVNVQSLIDGSTKEPVSIDVLKSKNVLLLISGLDISDDDISILKQVYDSTRNDDHEYKIVWLPIVDQWNDEDLQKKFESLQSTMPLYMVHHFSSIAGIRIVKEKWYFMGKPSVVVSNSPGREEHVYEINMIGLLGIKVFPFKNDEGAEIISNEIDLIGSLVTTLHPNIREWIQDDQKYIFFYGGNDEWIKQFEHRARVVAEFMEARISIQLACVEKGSKGEDNRGRFWTGIESMFISKTHRKTDSPDSMIGEIWKLLSYKNESGWAILSKGSNVVLSGPGTTIMKVVEDFDKWKELVLEKGLDVTIKDQHKNVLGTTTHICRRIDVISNTSGIIPYQNMKCPYCDRTMVMETYISFKYCCHELPKQKKKYCCHEH